MRTNNLVILDVIAEHMEKLTIIHVNQRRLRNNLYISVRREDPQEIALIRLEKYP